MSPIVLLLLCRFFLAVVLSHEEVATKQQLPGGYPSKVPVEPTQEPTVAQFSHSMQVTFLDEVQACAVCLVELVEDIVSLLCGHQPHKNPE